MTISLVQIEIEKTIKTSLKTLGKDIAKELCQDLKRNLNIYNVNVKSVSIVIMSNEYYKVYINTDYKNYIYAVQLVFNGDVVEKVNIL